MSDFASTNSNEIQPVILHVDMDAYYASVEIRDRPELASQPVIVGGSPDGRGVVCAANYIARQFGVHSAMPAAQAKRRCPDAIFLRPRMEHYAAISKQIRKIFLQYTPLVEPLSLDEAFLDVRGSEKLFGPSEEIGRQIKAAIRRELDLIASVGVAPNKFLAKMASDLDKPDGFVVVDGDKVDEFLAPLPITRLWGVGRVTAQQMDQLGIKTIGQVREKSVELMSELFGKQGRHLWELAQGHDDRRVVPDRHAKSISHETTFPADIADREIWRAWAIELTEQVARRLRRHSLKGRTVQLKLRYSDFQTITRALTLAAPTSSTQPLLDAVNALISDRLPARRMPIRLIGVGVSGFQETRPQQRLLFDEEEQEQNEHLDDAIDKMRDKFGKGAIQRATRMMHQPEVTPPPSPKDSAESDGIAD